MKLKKLLDKIQLIYADLIDGSSIQRCFTKILDETPEFSRFEVYNLAAQSHVHISYENPEYTSLVDGIGTLTIVGSLQNKSNTRNKIPQKFIGDMNYRCVFPIQIRKNLINADSPKVLQSKHEIKTSLGNFSFAKNSAQTTRK